MNFLIYGEILIFSSISAHGHLSLYLALAFSWHGPILTLTCYMRQSVVVSLAFFVFQTKKITMGNEGIFFPYYFPSIECKCIGIVCDLRVRVKEGAGTSHCWCRPSVPEPCADQVLEVWENYQRSIYSIEWWREMSFLRRRGGQM